MAYKLGSIPSPRASREELADFMEFECLRTPDASFSVTDAAQIMGVVDDEVTATNEEDDNIDNLKMVLSVVDDRKKWANGKYPFYTDIVTINRDINQSRFVSAVYIFLLLATRENMQGSSRLVDKLDGTVLFEQLCAKVLKNYFGEHSHSFVFGTGADDRESFKEKIKRMLSSFKEKGYTITDKPQNPFQKDGGIDIVSFTPFTDARQGHFIVLGQCKTGTSWKDSLSSLSPDILDDYINPSLVSKAYTVFLVTADCGTPNDWNTMVRKVRGVLMDRCRLMSYLPDNLDNNFVDELERWNCGVLERYKL